METSTTVGNEAADKLDVPLVPYRKPLRTWAGHGTGATCHRCGRLIEAHDIEYEIELPTGGEERAGRYQAHSDAPSLRFHFACYRKWTGR
jgi:hypothetical protein